MNKYQRITNRIAKAEQNQWNKSDRYNPISFRESRIAIRQVFKSDPYEELKGYYKFWFKKGVK